jgi:hypothetical protein
MSKCNLVTVHQSLFKQYPDIKGFLECHRALFKTSSNQWAHQALRFTRVAETIIVLVDACGEDFIMNARDKIIVCSPLVCVGL